MWVERGTDARMRRTANRPLPAGVCIHMEVVVLRDGAGCHRGQLPVPRPADAGRGMVAALTFVTYVAVYTPLKHDHRRGTRTSGRFPGRCRR